MEAGDLLLAALDAEYAAVVAQTRAAPAPAEAEDKTPEGESENQAADDSESEEDDGEGAGYSLLPSSPTHGGADSDDDEATEDEKQQEKLAESEKSEKQEQKLPADKRSAIMSAMQGLKLQAPAWAADGRVTDEQLVALVQKQLGK